MPVELIIGPSVKSMSRTAAERALTQNPDFPQGAEYTLATHAGHYIAAFAVQAGPPFDGAPADSDEDSAGPKSEGPDDTAPAEGGGASESKPPSEGEGGESKSEGKPGESKGGEAHGIAELKLDLQAIADALGVTLPSTAAGSGLDGPVPGADAPLGPPGSAGPPAPHPAPPAPHPAGPPGGPAGPAGPGGPNQHVIHEKAGPPPIPTFASTDHPWAHTVGKVAHFRVAEEIGERDVTEIEAELQTIARAGGFEVRRAQIEKSDDGVKRFAAIIKTPQV